MLNGNTKNARRPESDDRMDETFELLMTRSPKELKVTTPMNSHLKIVDNFSPDSHVDHQDFLLPTIANTIHDPKYKD